MNIFTIKANWFVFLVAVLSSAQRERYFHQKSKGFPWPLPVNFKSNPSATCQVSEQLRFDFGAGPISGCDLMIEAEKRAFRYIFGKRTTCSGATVVLGQFSNVLIRLLGNNSLPPKECQQNEFPPSKGMDESYHLEVSCYPNPMAKIVAKSIWGLVRGIETFTQLVYNLDSGERMINETVIDDKPAFQWRGILLDTGHRFQPMSILLKNLEIMAVNKFNVFHWHMVDDPSFPWVSKKFPQLAKSGAYRPVVLHSYSPRDVRTVIEKARLLGIRVVPEFDTPGHSQSWGSGLPELLTECYNTSTGKVTGNYGPFDPSNPEMWKIVKEIFREIFASFPDKFVHLGGDEAFYGFDCWLSNPRLQNLMKLLNITTGDEIQRYYTQEQLKMLEKLDQKLVRNFIFWEEVFNAKIPLPTDRTVIQVWWNNQTLLAPITESGLRAIYSSCWYLDHVDNTTDWKGYYECDPLAFSAKNPKQKELVLGGEACLWTKYVDSVNVLPRLWPRASAVAERLWTNPREIIWHDIEMRLEEHRCRMVGRGFPAQPVIGPGFCDVEYSEF